MVHRCGCAVFVLSCPGNEQVKHAVCSSGVVVLLFQYLLDALLELRDSGVHALAAVISPKGSIIQFWQQLIAWLRFVL